MYIEGGGRKQVRGQAEKRDEPALYHTRKMPSVNKCPQNERFMAQ